MICANKRITHPASLSPDERMKYRDSFVGKSVTEALPDGSAIYAFEDNGRFYLTVFAGKALRTYVHGWYRTETSRANAIEKFKQGRTNYHATRLLRHEEAKRPRTLKTGDILSSSWGYEQTNVEFYEIVAVSGVMVTLREIAASVKETTGYMSGLKIPTPGVFIGEPIQRKVNSSNGVKIDSSISASVWSGRPEFFSSYA